MSQTALREKIQRFIDGNWLGARRLQGLQGGARAYLLALAAESARRPILVISASAREAENFYSDLVFFLGEDSVLPPVRKRLHLLPSWEVLPFEKLSPHPDNVAARLEAALRDHGLKLRR
jgi:transcription-repair coupling factor (superfamily II helicase)